MPDIKLAIKDEEFEQCYPLMRQLRPHLKQNTFLETIKCLQQDGYQLAYLFHENQVVALAGFRVSNNLFMGKHLYIDDLVTDENQRSKGYGKVLLDGIRHIAKETDCNYLHLDSGTHRHQAHKFYFQQGLNIASYHFSQNLKG